MQVLFEPDSRSSDSVSYDLTAWALPYVYNIEAYAYRERLPVADGPAIADSPAENLSDTVRPYAYAASMSGFNELKFMAQLYKSGLNVRFSLKPFIAAGTSFSRGSVIVARGDNRNNDLFDAKVRAAAASSGVRPGDACRRNGDIRQGPRVRLLTGEQRTGGSPDRRPGDIAGIRGDMVLYGAGA